MEQLTNIVPGWPRMVRLTAVGFILAGASLWMACSGATRTSMSVAGVIALLGTVMVLALGSYWDVYLDQLSLGPIPPAVDGMPPPRMAPATAFGFQLLGLSLLFAGPRRSALLHQALAIAGLLVGWAACRVSCSAASRRSRSRTWRSTPRCCSCCPVAGVLTLRTDVGIAALLVSDGVGGAMARRLLPAAIVIPLAAGALTVHYERRATFGFEAAVAVFALLEHDRVRGLRVGERRARRPCRPAATPGRARAAALRGTLPAQFRDRARRHHHDRPAGADHGLEHSARKGCSAGRAPRHWVASWPSW